MQILKSFLLFGFLFAVNTSVWAQGSLSGFAGEWSGRGTYVLDGDMTSCSTMRMIFGAGGNRFQFVTGQRNCDKHDESFPPVTLTTKDGSMFFNGQKVGSYTPQTVELGFRMAEGNGRFRIWRMSMRVSGDHLMYEESRTMEGEVTPLISFAGILLRQ